MPAKPTVTFSSTLRTPHGRNPPSSACLLADPNVRGPGHLIFALSDDALRAAVPPKYLRYPGIWNVTLRHPSVTDGTLIHVNSYIPLTVFSAATSRSQSISGWAMAGILAALFVTILVGAVALTSALDRRRHSLRSARRKECCRHKLQQFTMHH